MKLLGVLGLAWLLLGAAPPADRCASCHRGIEEAHPKLSLTCTTCHGGDGRAASAGQAHRGMWPNPSDLRVADRTCGAGGCHPTIAARVKNNIMAHRSGTQSGTLFPNGLQPTREAVKFSMAPVATAPVELPAGTVSRAPTEIPVPSRMRATASGTSA